MAVKKRQAADDEDELLEAGVNRTLLTGGLSYESELCLLSVRVPFSSIVSFLVWF